MRRRANREGSIYQAEDHGQTRWVAACPGGRPRFSAKTQAEAVAKRDAWLRANPTKAASRSSGSFGRYLSNWLAKKKAEVRTNTYNSYRLTIEEYVVPVIGEVSIALLSSADVQQAVDAAAKAGKHRTAEYVRIVCRMVLNDAVEDGKIGRNVAKKLKPHKYDKRKANPIYGDELQALLTHIAGKDIEAIVLVDLMGLRRGELLGLQWPDYVDGSLRIERQLANHSGGRAVAPLKSESGKRTIVLPEFVRAALDKHRTRQRELFLMLGAPQEFEGSHIFTNGIGGPMFPRKANALFTRIFSDAGLPHRTMHDMRHTAASLLLAYGGELHHVSDLLGHSRAAFTKDKYGHSIAPGMQRIADRMDQIFGGKK